MVMDGKTLAGAFTGVRHGRRLSGNAAAYCPIWTHHPPTAGAAPPARSVYLGAAVQCCAARYNRAWTSGLRLVMLKLGAASLGNVAINGLPARETPYALHNRKPPAESGRA